ncbi:PDZ domain-containing protein [Thiorhodococcus minor]|uniref:PDZ domain-containing protein n=1 Tax=Thiorhodococcus minor TaxID=57489 RepID=A0A6M0K4G3_9GAMM|nr:PDZ domain-containing protein [Thiorhodococcus minor]
MSTTETEESAPPEGTSEEAAPAAELTPPEPSPGLVARVDDLAAGWGRMQAELAELHQRVGQLEQRPAVAANDGPEERRAALARTTEQQRDALVKAGVAVDVAEDILWRRAQVSLERLYTRDRAAREGWLNTDRYQEELSRINEQRVSLRDEVGTEVYDRYLFETGEDNRILVDSVIPGSAGDESGMLPGDVIERYGDEPILGFRDLRGATTEGEPGELVPVQVRRAGGMVELLLPRGPIGIRLDSTRVEPKG